MKNRRSTIFILIIILVMISVACGLGKKSSDLLGDEYRSDTGGFTIRKINGYDFNDSFGIVEMTAPDGTIEAGPGFMIMGGLMEEDLSNEDLLENMKSQASTIEIGKTKKIKVAGVKGLLADLSGEYNGVSIKGKIFMAMYSPKQEFVLMGLAPKNQWISIEPLFDEVLESVTFFEAEPFVSSSDNGIGFNDLAIGSGSDRTEPQLIRQWASYAYAESEYSSTEWSAMRATGPSDVETCGENVNAWAAAHSDGLDSIELVYDVPVNPTEINIYQSNNPSQVVEVDIIDLNGEAWIAWMGEPELVNSCPDLMTISIELDEPLYIDRVVVFIDQSVLQIGYTEIDAVELVGYTQGLQTNDYNEEDYVQEEGNDSLKPGLSDDIVNPTNYSGWMAGPVYQGWINVIINETNVKDLDKIMTIKGTRSTENWKPRPDHSDTFIYEMGPDGMKGYISVTTEGIVYKKSITPNKYPPDFQLATVTRENYNALDEIYKQDYVIPYAVMANLLQSPGFLFEQYFRVDDGKMVSMYVWLAPNGDRMSGFFYDGLLTGMAGLVFIPKE